MKITINDTVSELADGATVETALQQCDIPLAGIAVAVNDKVVPRQQHATHVLAEGDKMIIIKAFDGG